MEKEQEVREIHNERPFDVVVADVAFLTNAFLIVRHAIDVYADNHLKNLTACDGNIHPFGNLETKCSECIIGVHYRVYSIVH